MRKRERERHRELNLSDFLLFPVRISSVCQSEPASQPEREMVQENDDKLALFQAVTGLPDPSLCVQILQAHGWDLDKAVSSMADAGPPDRAALARADGRSSQWSPSTSAHHRPPARHDPSEATASSASLGRYDGNSVNPAEAHMMGDERRAGRIVANPGGPGVVWKIVTLPFSIIRGSYNVMYGAFGLGMWIASGVLSHSLGALGWGTGDAEGGTRQRDEGMAPLLPISTGAAEAMAFARSFDREYGEYHPAFQTTSFMDALRRAKEEFKFLFVYLHSPEHENTPVFCERTLCSDTVVQFVNENFVAWGGNVRATEGFRMSNTLKASTFPFCALVMASSNQRIALLQQVEGLKTAEELVTILHKVVEEQGTALVAARIEEEERRLNRQLREEQDAAYQAALQADQERERKRQEEEERIAREAAETKRRQKEEEEAAAQAAHEAAEREAALERRRQEKAMALGSEPEKGPNVTEVLVRFPNGERKERRFHCTATILSVYDYVDSLHCFDAVSYKLLSNFPRVVYGPDKFGLSLKDAGLHPRASLYVQVEDA